MIKFILVFLMTGCSVHRTAIKGTVDVIEDNWCAIEVDSENNENLWVNIDSRKIKNIKEGDKVVFYVRVREGVE